MDETQQVVAVRRQLARLVATRGPEVLDDPRRLHAMLADAVAGAGEESALVRLAVTLGVPVRLRAGEPAAEIERELGSGPMPPAAARWVVDALARALDPDGAAAPEVPAVPEVPAEPQRPAPAPAPLAEPRLAVTVEETTTELEAGTVALVGRDPSCAVTVTGAAASRLHGQLSYADGAWVYEDTGSTQGSFVEGRQVETLVVTDRVVLVLGQGEERSEVVLDPVQAGPRPAAPHDATITNDPDPSAADPAAEEAFVILGSQRRVLRPGETVSLGRDPANSLSTTSASSSRRHAEIAYVGGTWWLTDLGSSAGTWLAGNRVSRVELGGHQELVLGDPGTGDRLVVQTPQPAGAPPPAPEVPERPPTRPREVPKPDPWVTPVPAPPQGRSGDLRRLAVGFAIGFVVLTLVVFLAVRMLLG